MEMKMEDGGWRMEDGRMEDGARGSEPWFIPTVAALRETRVAKKESACIATKGLR